MFGCRFRITAIQCVALTVGAVFGLLSSIREVHDLTPQPPVPPRVHNQHKLNTYIQPNTLRSGHLDPNDGIITDDKPEPKHADLRPKSDPLQLDESVMGPVVNPHPYEYVIDPKGACKDPDLFLVAYIHTAPDHYDRRNQIRKTWGNTSLYGNVKVKVFFMMGLPGSPETQRAMNLESHQFKDIVQENYVDAYHNLSYKAIGAMRWVSTRCKQAKFVLKTDDDVFINTFTLIKHLRDLDRARGSNSGLLMCLVWFKMHVLREGKWKIDESVIPDEYYPHYCSGMGYIMSLDVAEAIYKASAYVPFFWVDDVYITGMVPKRLNLTHVDIVKLFMGRKEVDWLLSGPDWYKYIFCHLRDMPFYLQMWNKLVKRALTDQIPDLHDVVPGRLAIKYGPKKPPDSENGKLSNVKKPVVKKSAKVL